MIVELQESYPGEFAERPAVLQDRLHKAMHKALSSIAGPAARGGELRVLDDLADLTAKLYADRSTQLAADMAKVTGDEPQI